MNIELVLKNGKPSLKVLENLRASLIEDHPDVIRRNPALMDRLHAMLKEMGAQPYCA